MKKYLVTLLITFLFTKNIYAASSANNEGPSHREFFMKYAAKNYPPNTSNLSAKPKNEALIRALASSTTTATLTSCYRALLRRAGFEELANHFNNTSDLCGVEVSDLLSLDALCQLAPVKHGLVQRDDLERYFTEDPERLFDFLDTVRAMIYHGGGEDVFARANEINKAFLHKKALQRADEEHNSAIFAQKKSFLNAQKAAFLSIALKSELWFFVTKALMSTAGVIAAAWVIKMLIEHLLAYLMQRRPVLIKKTNIRFGLTSWAPFRWFFWSPKLPNREGELVLSNDIIMKSKALINRINAANKSTKEEIPNIIMEGEPGVGKTAVVEEIIRQTGCLYAKIDGASLLQWPTNEAVEEANKLLNVLESQQKPCYLFIDEADVLFGSRCEDREVAKILNPFLSRFSKSRGRIAFIATTNLFDNLDDALVNRVGATAIWSFQRPTPVQAAQIAIVHLNKVVAGRNVDNSIDFASVGVKRKLVAAIKSSNFPLVGRQIEEIAQVAADTAVDAGRELLLNDFTNQL